MAANFDDWITFREARQILTCSREALDRLIRKGIVGVRRVPTARPRVKRSDCERICKAATREAGV